MSKLSQFLVSRALLLNILILLLSCVVGYFVITAWMNNYTHHGENIDVPDLRGITISKLDTILKPHDFHYKIIDSLYDAERPPGAVIDQDPAPKSKVKESRTIYLTVNSFQPPDIKMPDLIDVSYRQAEAILQSYGLLTGEITYKSDLAKNAVLEQRFNNRTIKPGTMIPKGSVIDLVLGDGLGDSEVFVPNLSGLSQSEAWSVLRRASLTIGIVQFDDEEDTVGAKIYRQYPDPTDGILLKAGDGVDIFLR